MPPALRVRVYLSRRRRRRRPRLPRLFSRFSSARMSGPAELMMLDRDESGLHALQLSIHGTALLDSPDTILADIRDAETVQAIFDERKPQVVFHAAALKHLPMLQQDPVEAWKTNVLGTLHVLEAARSVGVEKFVNISTDKAANPSSVLGSAKRIGERLVAVGQPPERGPVHRLGVLALADLR